MKIAYICTEKLPSPAVKGGAIQMMIDGVASYLTDNHELTVFSITDPLLPDRESKDNVTFMRFPREGYRMHVAEELKNHAFDLIHVFNRPKNVPLYKSSAPHSKFVLSLHNEMFTPRKLTDEEGKAAVEAVDAITTVSQFIKDTITERFPEAEEKTTVVYSGVNLEDYAPVWTVKGRMMRKYYRQKYGIQGRKVILFVGRLSNTKGPHILIQAMYSILNQHPDAVLVIVGGKWFSDNGVNSYVKYLHRLARPIKDHVVFTKYIPAEEIPTIFLVGDLFVCSSQWNEPLARVHYEAMAAGVPLITTNRGGNAEIIEDEWNGLIIDDYDNPHAFAQLINDTLSVPGFAEELARNGRDYVESNFDFKHVAKRLEDVYLQAVLTEELPLPEGSEVNES
ncbi:glycosyltransferase family 4 protein [Bacillus timonensis]|nr:glycosyltransferase family 4 protein [Bacillus timonensis]